MEIERQSTEFSISYRLGHIVTVLTVLGSYTSYTFGEDMISARFSSVIKLL